MLGSSAHYGGWTNSPVESDKSTLVPDCEGKQIPICNVLRRKQLSVVEQLGIGQADIVRPEAVVLGRFRHREALQDCGYRQRIRIAGTRHDARSSVFSDRTGRPTMLKFGGEPASSD